MTNPAPRTVFSHTQAVAVPSVLVVDDEQTFCIVMRDILAVFGCEVLQAHSVAQAIEILTRAIPDLVLTDVMMPDVDGLSLVRQMRQHALWAHIPVIVVSALTSEEDIRSSHAAGADGWLTKPFSIKALRDAVRLYLPATP
jgi:CheY-like chemotaxis protein